MIGSVLQAYVPGIGRTIELKVYYMAVQAEYATWSATRTKGDFDIRTFEVKARPDHPHRNRNPALRRGRIERLHRRTHRAENLNRLES